MNWSVGVMLRWAILSLDSNLDFLLLHWRVRPPVMNVCLLKPAWGGMLCRLLTSSEISADFVFFTGILVASERTNEWKKDTV